MILVYSNLKRNMHAPGPFFASQIHFINTHPTYKQVCPNINNTSFLIYLKTLVYTCDLP